VAASQPSNFNAAVRQLRESELECPKCHAWNVPGRKPTVVLDANHRVTCDQCGFVWFDKEQP
jgi:RNase P subunit RPR2